MRCFSSDDPAAVNVSLVYDFQDNNNNLWSRSSQGAALPPCFPTPPADGHQCTVCFHNRVYALCRDLSSRVDMTMETDRKSLSVSESDCPEAPPEDALPRDLVIYIAIAIAVAIVIVLVIFVVLRFRRSGDPREGRQDNGEDQPVALKEMTP